MPVPMVVTFPFEERRNWIGYSPRTLARRRSSFKEMEAILCKFFASGAVMTMRRNAATMRCKGGLIFGEKQEKRKRKALTLL